eukprot:CAMPEP_0183746698 /NCGR_PEP_ID=MMETSP0737-20130205/66892_1 /TAXON_ID=385413 /ORGANISM="Thalassiosira miniscula, Strain CCMP1093" /LENGTH=485 /DNA_ID=CAMNT_0025982401 /DNA_START=130 /DNA_END=1584 /DNA_ORIENTATION=-
MAESTPQEIRETTSGAAPGSQIEAPEPPEPANENPAVAEDDKENAAPATAKESSSSSSSSSPEPEEPASSASKVSGSDNAVESTTAPAPAAPAVVGVSKNRTKSSDVKPSLRRFSDFGAFGFYDGDLDESSKRHGRGTMHYDSGDTYVGPFVANKFHGDSGLYRWYDGDEQEGSWAEGERHGVSTFRGADGVVEINTYERGKVKGEGVTWNADRTVAHRMVDGKRAGKISISMAEKMARDKFGMEVPEPVEVVAAPAAAGAAEETSASASASSTASTGKEIGFIGRLFASRKVGSDGTLYFKDYGEWGSYEGDVDADGNRQGPGKMTYDSGGYFDGGFADDKFQGTGVYRWADGDEYEGEWKEGERCGKGSFTSADGTVEYSVYDKGSTVGEGVSFSPDRRTAHKVVDGKKQNEISLSMAEKLAKDMFDLPVPEPKAETTSTTPDIPATIKNVGLIGRLFSNKKVGPDGKIMFYDHGEWGTYDGE